MIQYRKSSRYEFGTIRLCPSADAGPENVPVYRAVQFSFRNENFVCVLLEYLKKVVIKPFELLGGGSDECMCLSTSSASSTMIPKKWEPLHDPRPLSPSSSRILCCPK